MKVSNNVILFLNELADYIENDDTDNFRDSFSFTHDIDKTIDYIRELDETDNVDTSKIGTFLENAIDYIYDIEPIGIDIITNKSKAIKEGYNETLEKIN